MVEKRRKAPSDGGVGYGRPPAGTRFKPGMSGNPNGRPKRAKAAVTIGQAFRDYLKGTVSAREGGKTRRIPRVEAVLHKFFSEAMNGHPSTVRQLMKMALSEDDVDEVATPQSELLPEDLEILRNYVRRRDEEGESG